MQRTIQILEVILIFSLFALPSILSSDNYIINQVEIKNEVDWWPMFCHDAANSAYSSCNVSEKNKILWNVKTDIMSSSSPVVVDGKVYVTTGYFSDGQILCIDLETGSFLWNYSEDAIWVSPVVINDYLYAAIQYGGRIICLNSLTGKLIWNTTLDPSVNIIEESPAFYNGKIYVACSCYLEYQNNNSGLYCLDAYDGSILWFYPTGRSMMFSPSIYDGKVYTIGVNNRLTCLDAENGNEIWTLPDFFIVYHPFILNDKIYVATLQGVIAGSVACIKDGEVLWQYHPDLNYGVTTTIVGRNNSIYFGTGNSKVSDPGKVVCLNAGTGEEKWSYMSKGNTIFTSRPSLTKDYLFIIRDYFYDVTHRICSICSFDVDTGERVWYYTIGMDFDNYIDGGIAIADNKIIVSSVESDDSGEVWGGVYCFDKSDSNLPPNSPSINYDEYNHLLALISIDPEGDKIRYGISWDNDQTVDEWTVFCESSTYVYVVCDDRRGEVGVVAEDEYGAQSDWVSITSKSKFFYFSIFERLIQRFPIFEKILNQITKGMFNV